MEIASTKVMVAPVSPKGGNSPGAEAKTSPLFEKGKYRKGPGEKGSHRTSDLPERLWVVEKDFLWRRSGTKRLSGKPD